MPLDHCPRSSRRRNGHSPTCFRSGHFIPMSFPPSSTGRSERYWGCSAGSRSPVSSSRVRVGCSAESSGSGSAALTLSLRAQASFAGRAAPSSLSQGGVAAGRMLHRSTAFFCAEVGAPACSRRGGARPAHRAEPLWLRVYDLPARPHLTLSLRGSAQLRAGRASPSSLIWGGVGAGRMPQRSTAFFCAEVGLLSAAGGVG
jgi:hypothetical protein